MSKTAKITALGCLLLIIIHLVASYFPKERLWGVNLLYFFPPIWRWVLCLFAITFLIPQVNKAFSGFWDGFSIPVIHKPGRANRYLKYSLFSLAGGIFFWIFKVRTFLLGDSFLRAREINLGGRNSYFTEPVDYLLHVKVSKLLGWDAFQSYAVLSVICGVVFLFLCLLLCDLFSKEQKERGLVLSVLVTLGANQMFFGYVESYTLVYVSIVLYIIVSLRYLKNRTKILLPILAFFLASALHLLALTLLPSLLYLVYMGSSHKMDAAGNSKKTIRVLSMIAVVLMVGVGIFLLQHYNPERKGWGYYLIYPLGNDQSYYSIFSFSHLLDLINHQLLVAPVGILILLISVLGLRNKLEFKDRTIQYLLILSGSMLAYAFFMDPKLGYSRDWDLFAFTGLGYTVLGIQLFLKGSREIKLKDLRYVTLGLLAASLISTFPWIYVNASEKKSVERIGYLLDLDKKRSPSGRENLAIYYDQKKEWQKEIQQWEKAIAITGSARYIDNLATVYFNNQQFDLALRELKRSLAIDSVFDFTHFGLAEVYVQTGRYEESIAEYRKAIQAKPSRTQYFENLGVLLTTLKRYPEAIQVFQEGLNSNPGYAPIYCNLGYAYYNIREFPLAEKYLNQYLERSPKADNAAEVREVLSSINQARLEDIKKETHPTK
jgi:tetratricopeptide (TPR) repeat protein